ncbi:hypothetical protein EX30DRAFT_343891 [Ascodesmis nigricans]|uniref:Uncharacterized protein n=1 Tax=Ascodesmis nigricans TaxID=341454 RepID=A0A4S2MRL6_9PEZI|nr:hypothetical protein EX30DRAFT_343891 [Ascodesmis nigricans]
MPSEDNAPLLHARGPPPRLPSLGFLYPIYGIPYLIAHKALHPPLRSRIVPLTLLSLVVFFILFFFLYLPHVLVLSFFHGPLAWVNAAFMILSEGATLIAIIAEAFMTEPQLIDTFDTIFVSNGFSYLVRRCRVVGPDGQLGEHKVYPYLKWQQSGRMTFWYILELPLNFIPVIGWPLFLSLQAWHLGRWQQLRYWQLLGYGEKERAMMVKRNRAGYWLFGLVHVLLQLVPVLSIFFLFSTTTGAGLWALEAERRKVKIGYGEEDREVEPEREDEELVPPVPGWIMRWLPWKR